MADKWQPPAQEGYGEDPWVRVDRERKEYLQNQATRWQRGELDPQYVTSEIRNEWELMQMKKGGEPVQGTFRDFIGPPTPPHLRPPIDPESNYGKDIIRAERSFGGTSIPNPYASEAIPLMMGILKRIQIPTIKPNKMVQK